MAIFQFFCEACAVETESWQKHNDPFPACKVCAGPTYRLIAGGTDFILKGGGWTGKHYMNRLGTPKRKAPKT